jgi:prevent-host-death family protein
MITVGAFEAKTKFSELLTRVERGETVVITRHGQPVARLVSESRSADVENKRRAFNALRSKLGAAGVTLGPTEIIAARDEGRR